MNNEQEENEITVNENSLNKLNRPLVLCRGICRDGTNCLNRAKYEGYCWRHRL